MAVTQLLTRGGRNVDKNGEPECPPSPSIEAHHIAPSVAQPRPRQIAFSLVQDITSDFVLFIFEAIQKLIHISKYTLI